MPDIDSPSLHDMRMAEECRPESKGGDARETVRSSVNARVLELQARESRRKPGDESSLFRAGEVFCPTWEGE